MQSSSPCSLYQLSNAVPVTILQINFVNLSNKISISKFLATYTYTMHSTQPPFPFSYIKAGNCHLVKPA